MDRLRVQAFLALALAVVAGTGIGIAVDRLALDRPPVERRFDRPPWGGGDRRQGDRLPRPFDEIGLTDTQRTEIRTIFEQYRPQTDSVMELFLPALQAIRDSVSAEISRVLTEEQRQQLQEDFGDFWRRGPRPGMRDGSPDRRPQRFRDSTRRN